MAFGYVEGCYYGGSFAIKRRKIIGFFRKVAKYAKKVNFSLIRSLRPSNDALFDAKK